MQPDCSVSNAVRSTARRSGQLHQPYSTALPSFLVPPPAAPAPDRVAPAAAPASPPPSSSCRSIGGSIPCSARNRSTAMRSRSAAPGLAAHRGIAPRSRNTLICPVTASMCITMPSRFIFAYYTLSGSGRASPKSSSCRMSSVTVFVVRLIGSPSLPGRAERPSCAESGRAARPRFTINDLFPDLFKVCASNQPKGISGGRCH